MMRNVRPIITMGILFGIWMAGVQLPAFSAYAIPVQIALPQPTIDFSDLDARDQFNRPIKSARAQRALEKLFVQSLNDLLLQNLTPINRRVGEFLSLSQRLFQHWFTRSFPGMQNWVQGWVQPKKEKKIIVISSKNHPPNSLQESKFTHVKSQTPFDGLICLILASTCLLR